MSAEQENIPPVSRIPRHPVTSPAKSGIPALSTNNKRKLPSSPIVPSKRGPSSTLGSSINGTRKPSAGFVPTVKKSVTTLRPTSAANVNKPPSARSTSVGSVSSTSSLGSKARPAGIAASRKPTVGATGMARTGGVLGRSVGPGRVASGPSGIGSGMVGTAQLKSHDGRIENVERMVGGFKELLEREQARISSLQMSQVDLQTLLATTQNVERETRRDLSSASEEIASLRSSHSREIDELERTIQRKDREKRSIEQELLESREEISRERQTIRDLKQSMAEQSTQHMSLSAQLVASQTQLSILQAEVERATFSVSAMKAELEVARQKARDAEDRAMKKIEEVEEERDRRVSEVEEELREAESIRRKLHNQVQELKGNIRVFARVRPALAHEMDSPDGTADITYGDERKAQETGQAEITITSKSETAMGKEREQINSFLFDKVFDATSGQKVVFEEISMLAQSVLDGYNVCIFAYGQTGSGKSWTMEGGDSEETAGMIPRAIDMIFTVSAHLKDRGWKYQMEGQFLEVYNEVINDLLGSGQFDTKKHEIKLDKDGKMSVTDVVSIPLSNPRQVHTLLDRARSRRAVAATLMNERSSRSHSVFTLKVRGVNPLTDEKCEAMLNLVDLAGSERLDSSGAGSNKDRLKETININKSLSALADVIGALGQGQQGGHVPYRNSTLTRLLQTSLSGSSKTLMLCNLSPLSAHLGETLCSLRFATKVNNTVVGTARKQITK